IDQRAVQEIGSLEGIEKTTPIILANAQATFLDGKTAAVTLVGAPAPAFIMGPEFNKIDSGSVQDLLQPYAVSAEYFNARSWETSLYLNKSIDINGKSARLAVIRKNAQALGASCMYPSLENATHFGNFLKAKITLIIH